MNASRTSRTQSRLEKSARESSNLGVHYEVEAKAMREKMLRLKALRLAKEAADAEVGGIGAPEVVEKLPKGKKKLSTP
jgi:hypothetical protein